MDELLSSKDETVNYLPATYAVVIKMNPGRSMTGRQRINDGEMTTYEASGARVELDGEDTANRLAKALIHAAQLCGAVDNDPFK